MIYNKECSIIVKGIAILLMLMHHLWGFPERIEAGQTYTHIGQFAGICVPIYVFCSGYGIAYSVRKAKNNYSKFILSVCKKTLLNYWTIFIIFVGIGFIVGYYPLNIKELTLNLFCIESTYNKEWWFIAMYLQFLFLSYFLFKLRGKTFVFSSLFTIFISFYLSRYTHNLFLLGLRTYWSIFVVGVLSSEYMILDKIDTVIKKIFKNKIIYLLLYSILFILIFKTSIFLPYKSWIYVPILVLIISNINFIPIVKKILSIFGKYSMNIWLIHTFFCYYYFKNIILTSMNPIIWLAELILISLPIAIVVNKLQEKLLSIFSNGHE